MRILAIVFLSGLLPSLSALPKSEGAGATVKDSVIINENKDARISASNGSTVNTGIQARGADIKDSTLTNTFTGNVNADSRSNVTTGIKADNAVIKNSDINVNTDANINAHNADVKTGVDISGARNATINTNYQGNISASGSTVKAGTVEGDVRNKKITTNVQEDISAHGKGVVIGTVKDGGGKPSVYEKESSTDFSKKGQTAQIGNVDVKTPIVREVKTSVGTGDFIEGMKTKHMADVYKDKGGVDPTGTKHVYVSGKEKEKAKKTGGSVGNTTVVDPRIRKVNTYVE